MRSYLPGGSRCAGSSAPGRVSSSWEPRRAAPPFLRTPETNPESAGETFRRLFLSPLLRSSSPLLFSPPPPQPLPPPSCTPPPGCRRAPSRSCAGGVRWGRRWGGRGGDQEVQTNKHSNPKSASTRLAGPEVEPSDTGSHGPCRPGSLSPAAPCGPLAPARPAEVPEPRGYGVDFLGSLFIYLFSGSGSLLPWIPPLHASLCSPSHPVPGRTGAGTRVCSGFWLEGRRPE